ncbi:MAG: hypothetical protein AABZ32_02725, partial [Bacteroidota bacterium]
NGQLLGGATFEVCRTYDRFGTDIADECVTVKDNNSPDVDADKGEFQLTNAMENMKKKGTKFITSQVAEWLDCGNKDATVYTNKRILEHYENGSQPLTISYQPSTIIEPCFIGENVQIINSTVGPFASIGENTVIENSTVENSIIQTNTKIKNAKLSNSMLGNFVEFSGNSNDASIGDYSIIKN